MWKLPELPHADISLALWYCPAPDCPQEEPKHRSYYLRFRGEAAWTERLVIGVFLLL